MILDGFLTFTGTAQGNVTGIGATAYTDAPTTGTQDCSNVIDLGVVNGLPASISGGGGGGARDISTGDDRMLLLSIIATTGFVYGAGGGSSIFELSGAPDNGSGAPGTYTIMWESPPVLQANLEQGAVIANVNVPRPVSGQAMPRFLKLTVVTSVATYTAGQIEAQIVIDRDDQVLGTGGAYSGYPAGLVVAN